MKNSIIFIVLFLFLAVTAFFWFQVLTIKDAPLVTPSSPPVITAEEAEEFIKLAQELLIDYRPELPELYGRDPFIREVLPIEQARAARSEPSDNLVLSSIIHNDLHALAVVNGKILAEGDTIYDEESGISFMIQNIQTDKVEIMDGENKYTLEVVIKGGK